MYFLACHIILKWSKIQLIVIDYWHLSWFMPIMGKFIDPQILLEEFYRSYRIMLENSQSGLLYSLFASFLVLDERFDDRILHTSTYMWEYMGIDPIVVIAFLMSVFISHLERWIWRYHQRLSLLAIMFDVLQVLEMVYMIILLRTIFLYLLVPLVYGISFQLSGFLPLFCFSYGIDLLVEIINRRRIWISLFTFFHF